MTTISSRTAAALDTAAVKTVAAAATGVTLSRSTSSSSGPSNSRIGGHSDLATNCGSSSNSNGYSGRRCGNAYDNSLRPQTCRRDGSNDPGECHSSGLLQGQPQTTLRSPSGSRLYEYWIYMQLYEDATDPTSDEAPETT